MNKLEGLGVALVTPFNKDLSIDFDGLTRLVEFNISNGVDYIVVLGQLPKQQLFLMRKRRL